MRKGSRKEERQLESRGSVVSSVDGGTGDEQGAHKRSRSHKKGGASAKERREKKAKKKGRPNAENVRRSNESIVIAILVFNVWILSSFYSSFCA